MTSPLGIAPVPKPEIFEVRVSEGRSKPARYIYVALIDGVMTDLAPWGNRLPPEVRE